MQRTAFVTGASGGIGSAVAVKLAAEDWRVFAGVRNGAAPQGTIPVRLDVTDDDSVAAAAATIGEQSGELHGLVNSAGIFHQGPVELVPLHALRRVLETNVIGQVAVTQALLPLLRAGRGRIVDVGAVSGRGGIPMLGAIGASKAAFAVLDEALRMELRHQGISVSLVEPGALRTELFARAEAAAREDGVGGTPGAAAVYAKAVEAAGAAMSRSEPSEVDGVVTAIHHALTARRPRQRYVIGSDARQLATLVRLPRRVRERLLMRTLGLDAAAFG